MMRMCLKTGLIALGVVCVSGWAHATIAAERPNVVLMLADNLGFGDIGAYGGGEILGTPSPNLDSLALEDVGSERCTGAPRADLVRVVMSSESLRRVQ